jgi:hypothetical protein
MEFIYKVLRHFRGLIETHRLQIWTCIWILFGIFLGILFIEVNSNPKRIDFAAVYIWVLAFFILGALIGCLFGVPKAVSTATKSVPIQTTTGVSPEPQVDIEKSDDVKPAEIKQDNTKPPVGTVGVTNLTEISEWLTKIVIGAGLVELKSIPPFVMKIAGRMAHDIDISKSYHSNTLCAGILVYYTCFGLISGYFVMRTIFNDVL